MEWFLVGVAKAGGVTTRSPEELSRDKTKDHEKDDPERKLVADEPPAAVGVNVDIFAQEH